MHRRGSRFSALLVSAVLLFANGRGLLGPLDCPQHGIQTHRSTDARRTTHDAHAVHAAHAETAEKPQHQHAGCTCLEHCSACQASGMPSVAVRVPETPIIIGTAFVTPSAATHVAVRADHQLPFAQAPPAVV